MRTRSFVCVPCRKVVSRSVRDKIAREKAKCPGCGGKLCDTNQKIPPKHSNRGWKKIREYIERLYGVKLPATSSVKGKKR